MESMEGPASATPLHAPRLHPQVMSHPPGYGHGHGHGHGSAEGARQRLLLNRASDDILVRGSASGNVFNFRKSARPSEAPHHHAERRGHAHSLSPQRTMEAPTYGSLLPVRPRTYSEDSRTSDGSVRVGKHLPVFVLHHRNTFAVLCSIFMNLLDACTFGTVLFPVILGNKMASVGISTYLLSTAVVQVVLNFLSGFKCGMGTAQAENIPSLHLMATGVIDAFAAKDMGPEAAIPTILVCYSASTVLVGILFYGIGWAQLGKVLHFFPRHVIVGCVGGFGVFLCITGLEISSGLPLSDMTFTDACYALFLPSIRWLWISVIPLLVFLRLLEGLERAEILTPLFMLTIPFGFYAIIAAVGMSTDEAREYGWLFPIPPPGNFYDMWTHFDLGKVDWEAFSEQLPTMLSLALFLLVLIPIRVPSLSLTAKEEVDFDMEVMAQGIANIAAGCMGSVQNYLCYSNSVFFYNIGGHGSVAQWAIATGSFVMFMVGPGLITYVPRCVAGCVMASVGIDLLNDAIWASRKSFGKLEYASVLIITIVIAFWSFVSGIVVGVMLACVAFTIESSRAGAPVRSLFKSGPYAAVRSNTLYGPLKEAMLEQAEPAVHVLQLQGNLFFGNIQSVLQTIENELLQSSKPITDEAKEEKHNSSNGISPREHKRVFSPRSGSSAVGEPLGWVYCIVDCIHVVTADSTALAALAKLQRTVREEWDPPVDLALAGMDEDLVAQLEALQVADGLVEEDGNAAGGGDVEDSSGDAEEESFIQNHPDVNHALRIVEEEILSTLQEDCDVTHNLSQEAITANLERLVDSPLISKQALQRLTSLMKVEHVASGTTIWNIDDTPKCACYLVRGELSALYENELEQGILPGNLVGETELLRGVKRISSLVTVSDSVIGFIDGEEFETLFHKDFEVLCAVQHIALMKDAGSARPQLAPFIVDEFS